MFGPHPEDKLLDERMVKLSGDGRILASWK
jgi:hypothetical protein